MGEIKLEDIKFSKQIQNEWSDKSLWEKIINKEKIIPPSEV